MLNHDALNYVNQQRAAGVSDDVIRAALQQSGWDAGSIQEAITGTISASPVPTTAPTTARAGGLIKKLLSIVIFLGVISAAASFAAMRYMPGVFSNLPSSLPVGNTNTSGTVVVEPGVTKAVEFANRVIAMVEQGSNGGNPKLVPVITKAKSTIQAMVEKKNPILFGEDGTLMMQDLYQVVPYPSQPSSEAEQEQLACHIALITWDKVKIDLSTCGHYPELVDAYIVYNAASVVNVAYWANKTLSAMGTSSEAVANSFMGPGAVNTFALSTVLGVKTTAQGVARALALQTGNAEMVTSTGDVLLQRTDESKEVAQQRLGNVNDPIFWQDINGILDRIQATRTAR